MFAALFCLAHLHLVSINYLPREDGAAPFAIQLFGCGHHLPICTPYRGRPPRNCRSALEWAPSRREPVRGRARLNHFRLRIGHTEGIVRATHTAVQASVDNLGAGTLSRAPKLLLQNKNHIEFAVCSRIPLTLLRFEIPGPVSHSRGKVEAFAWKARIATCIAEVDGDGVVVVLRLVRLHEDQGGGAAGGEVESCTMQEYRQMHVRVIR